MKESHFHEEKTLLKKVAKGDEYAFQLLYERYQPELSSFIYTITCSKELTAELVQDIFLKIWLSRETLTEIKAFKPYLYIISRNQAINAFRKTMKEILKFSELREDHVSDFSDEDNDAENEKLNLVDMAIDNLSPKRKEVYILHRHHRLTYQEIAEKLGVGKETVKTHIDLAVKSIKKYLLNRITVLALLIEIFSKNI